MNKFTIKIPFFTKDVFCYELNIKQYKILLKSLFTDSINNEFLINVNSILNSVTTLTLEDIEQLNFVEYFSLLTFIRNTSIGSVLPLIVTDDDKKINLEVNLNTTLENLQHILFLDYSPIISNNMEVYIELPTIKELSTTSISLITFIKKIKLKNTFVSDKKDIESILKFLTVQHMADITQRCNILIEKIQNMYFFKSGNKKFDIPFIADSNEILFLIKLLFGENLVNVYNDIFYLGKYANISAEYLENCSPGEFKIFVKNLEEILQPSAPVEEVNNITDATSSFEEFATSTNT